MNHSARWALSPLDCQAHLLVSAGDHPWGVLKARCGEVLPPGGPPQHERSPWGAHRTCPRCAEIAQSPPTSILAGRWVSPQDPAEGQSVPAASSTTTRALRARCPVDERLHLLSARAVLQLAAVGCARAWCGVLLTIQDLVLRAVGTPCKECLAAGSTS
ncbi:MAG: hypothetical protein ACRDRQ_20280 [Pseudonocardiaceae bacterium]